MDQQSIGKENPLVLMAQACNNIGKELTSFSSSLSTSSKQRKSSSTTEGRKSLKRTHPTDLVSPPAKKISPSQPSIPAFDSSISPMYPTTTSLTYSAFSPIFPQSSYLLDSIFTRPLLYNWFNSMYSDEFPGKSFPNHFPFLAPSSIEKR